MASAALDTLARIIKSARGEGLKAQLIRGGVGTIFIKLSYTALRFIFAVVLARVLGPAELGVYSYVFVLISLLAIPSELGLPALVVRETARAQANEQWSLMRGLWRWASFASGFFTLLVAGIALIVLWLFAENRFSAAELKTFWLGLLLLPLTALGNLRGAALRGLRKVVLGQLPEFVLKPMLLVCFVLAAAWLLPDGYLTAASAMWMQVWASVAAFVVGAYLLWRETPAALRSALPASYRAREWFGSTLPLASIAAIQFVNNYIDILMLGIFGTSADVGVYRVATQGAALSLIGLQIVTTATAPQIARLYARNERERLQKVASVSARTSLLMALPVALAFCLGGAQILTYVFGGEYAGAHRALAILSIGQLVSATFGPLGSILNMTGHERDTARGVLMAAIVNILLNAILIPLIGMNGAAIASVCSLCTWNALLWRVLGKRTGLNTLQLWGRRRERHG